MMMEVSPFGYKDGHYTSQGKEPPLNRRDKHSLPLLTHSNYIFVNKSNYFFLKCCHICNLDTFIFYVLVRPQQPRRSDGKPQILLWILIKKKREDFGVI